MNTDPKHWFCDFFCTFYLWKMMYMYLQKVKSRKTFFSFLLASWRPMTKIAGSRFNSQRHGSADPDPHQNVMDPEHWYYKYCLGVSTCPRHIVQLYWYTVSGFLEISTCTYPVTQRVWLYRLRHTNVCQSKGKSPREEIGLKQSHKFHTIIF